MKNPLNRFLVQLLLLAAPVCASAQPDAAEDTAAATGEEIDTAPSPQSSPSPEPLSQEALSQEALSQEALSQEALSQEALSQEARQTALLADALAGEGLVELNAEGEAFIALWQADISGDPLGAALILPGNGQTVDWPESIGNIRSYLPSHGWATLVISLPDPITPRPPDRPEPAVAGNTQTAGENPAAPDETADQPTDPAADAPDNSEDLVEQQGNNGAEVQTEKTPTRAGQANPEDIEATTQARIRVAMDYLNQQGQYNIVLIGHGLGAARAARYVDSISGQEVALPDTGKTDRTKAVIDRPVRAMVWVNARNRIPHAPEVATLSITDWLNDTGLPVLDVFSDSFQLDPQEPRGRKLGARQQRMELFQQVRLLPPRGPAPEGETPLAKRVRGFLEKHARGVEIDQPGS